MTDTNNRIDNKHLSKTRKFLLVCSIAISVFAIAKVINKTEIELASNGWWIDTLILILPSLYFGTKGQKQLKLMEEQFIQWETDKLIYKLKGDSEQTEINKSDIKSIDITLNIIKITTKTNQNFNLNISDFHKYKVRKEIKERFAKEGNSA